MDTGSCVRRESLTKPRRLRPIICSPDRRAKMRQYTGMTERAPLRRNLPGPSHGPKGTSVSAREGVAGLSRVIAGGLDGRRTHACATGPTTLGLEEVDLGPILARAVRLEQSRRQMWFGGIT